jgi:HipA-like C-terminal domain
MVTGPLNHLDFLLAVDDASRVGGLRLQDEPGVFQRTPEQGRRTAPPLIELGRLAAASRSIETNSETAADLDYLRGRGTSLSGLRPKCTVVDDQGQLSIGKFPSVADQRAVTHGEVLAMRLARAAGVTAADARLVDSDGVHVALIKRFDLNPFPDRVRELKTWVSEETGPEATTDALMSVVRYFKISKARAREIVHEVERVIAGWRDEGHRIGMTDAASSPSCQPSRTQSATRRGATDLYCGPGFSCDLQTFACSSSLGGPCNPRERRREPVRRRRRVLANDQHVRGCDPLRRRRTVRRLRLPERLLPDDVHRERGPLRGRIDLRPYIEHLLLTGLAERSEGASPPSSTDTA